MDEIAQVYRRLAAMQGVELVEARAVAAAEILQRQLAAEQAATRALAFETEPASFAATLYAGSK